jgi:hypothetical protein
MHIRRLRTAIAALAICSLTLAAAPAVAGKTAKTKLKLTSLSADGGSGVVKSKKQKCRKGRKVTLKFVGEYTDVRIGSTKSKSDGAWAVNKSLSDSGIYYASVKKKKVGNLTCAAATSRDKRL